MAVHSIRRQVVEAELEGTEADGMAVQSRLAALCADTLPPVIDRVLAEAAPSQGDLSIERLEIDLGSISFADLERELPRALEHALATYFRQQLASPSRPGAASVDSARWRSAGEGLEDALRHFLATGQLPWSFRLPRGVSFEEILISGWGSGALEPEPSALARMLVTETARQRAVRQFSGAFLERILARLSFPAVNAVKACLAALASDRAVEERNIAVIRRALWEAAFASALGGQPISAPGLVREAWGRLSPRFDDPRVLAGVLDRAWPGIIAEPGKPSIDPPPQGPSRPYPSDPGTVSRATSAPPRMPGDPWRAGPEDARFDDVAGDGIFINNAGLVLLHPFLPRFFEVVGVASDDELLQPERAVCLLHFLATGQAVAPEYELALPKAFCNIPLDQPVESAVDLTPFEMEEAIGLLEAAIRHWDVLRDTSPDGLRGSFLLRTGKLTLDDDSGDFVLHVEAQSFDLLLDYLPWAISMFRLPWMSRILQVRWR